MQLEAIASHLITSYLGEETNTCLTVTSFQTAVESNKVSPQPPLLQTKQPRFPQPLRTEGDHRHRHRHRHHGPHQRRGPSALCNTPASTARPSKPGPGHCRGVRGGPSVSGGRLPPGAACGPAGSRGEQAAEQRGGRAGRRRARGAGPFPLLAVAGVGDTAAAVTS